ncbi:MAG: hypothetical protein K2K64_00690 [Muribaculaceae bacterium]|nr:hypothetical protein [Muribaculaceae bacterium]
MRKILLILAALMTVLGLQAQGGSGVGYDPTNPPDPQTGYRLSIGVMPAKGGTTNPAQAKYLQEGNQIYVSASPRLGYTFRAWMEGDEEVSNSESFYYTMPGRNVKLTAWFDEEEYNPANPGDPFINGYEHRLSAYCVPSTAGYVSGANRLVREGEETTLYAYPNSSFKFSCWKQNGEIISLDPNLTVKMGDKNLEYTAQFVYNPDSPKSPGANSWNKATGELVIDDFEPSCLWNVISSIVNESERELVTSLTVIGKIYDYDFGAMNLLPQLTTSDFSRTTGSRQLPNYCMENLGNLTRLILPASLEEICDCSFYGCTNLSELICYAVIPPAMYWNEIYGVPDGLVIKVYANSIDLYRSAEGWKEYRILPIDEESTVLRVFLPSDANDGWYVNSSLQLDNLATGQSQKLVITRGKNTYLFGNLIPDLKYNLYVLSPNGATLGKLLDFEVPSEGKDYEFTQLLHTHPLTLTITTPEGENVTDKCEISWYGQYGEFLGSGRELTGQVEGAKLKYAIRLPNELAQLYNIPAEGSHQVSETDNQIIENLSPIEKTEVEGYLYDSLTGEAIKGGYITIEQIVNGAYRTATTYMTGADGYFKAWVSNTVGAITAGSSLHHETDLNFTDLKDLVSKILKLLLKPLSGNKVSLTMLSRKNVVKGIEDEATVPYSDHANLVFKIRNLTSGEQMSHYLFANPDLILLDEAKAGDKIEIIAEPRNGDYTNATAVVELKGDKNKATLLFVPQGEISLSYGASDAENNVAMLYDKDGKLVSKTDFIKGKGNFSNLSEGDYTVVAMEATGKYSSAGSLSEFRQSNLTEGEDYLLSEVRVENGYIEPVYFDLIPKLDITLPTYTGAETAVSVNKTSVTVGGFVTVRSKVDILREYADKIDKVKITFSIPEGCDYVENSLLLGGESNFTTIGDHTLSVDLPVKYANPRFCIIPRTAGEYRPSAVLEFEVDGQTVVQPMGSALFVANDFSISVPEKTSSPKISARGTAKPQSDVKVYDNGVFIGSTHTQPNGEWRLSFNLFNVDNDAEHIIYARITTKDGVEYRTSAGTTIYDNEWAELTDIIMMNGSASIDFNQPDATTKAGSYSYVPGDDMFTFKTVFKNGKAADVENLKFIILLSDGSRREILAKYLPSSNVWTAALGFADIDRLPVNVKAIYTEKRMYGEDADNLVDNIKQSFRCPDVIPVIDPSGYVYEAVTSNRLQGVTATIYYKELVENMYGEVETRATKWYAEEYAQLNPQFTDEEGNYQWDVPQGEWQVRFEKEGYELFSTDWLPVPPPQLDINVGLVQMVAPEVVGVKAYEDGVEISFSKYMQNASVAAGRVVVTADGKNVEGTVRPLNLEVAPNGEEYASVFRFEPVSPITVRNVNVIVSKGVSYAGVQMQGAFEQEFAVEAEVKSINAPEIKELEVNDEGHIEVTVLPANASAGKILNVSLKSPIASIPKNVLIGEDGKAKVDIVPELLGSTILTFTVEGVSDLKTETRLNLYSKDVISDVETLSGDQSLLIMMKSDGVITVKGVNGRLTCIDLYDAAGMSLAPTRRVDSDSSFRVDGILKGFVIVKAVNSEEEAVAKIIVK